MKNHHRLPQGAPSSIWLQLTGVHMGGTIVVPLEIKPLRGPHGIMVGRHLLLPIVIFFFFEGVQHPTLQQMALQATTCVA